MKNFFKRVLPLALLFTASCSILVLTLAYPEPNTEMVVLVVEESMQARPHDPEWVEAYADAWRVYQKFSNCRENEIVTRLTAYYAIKKDLPARLIAAKISLESNCNPLAVSSKGAVGLTQVMPTIWGKTYGVDADSLTDPDTSVRVGADILANYIAEHGMYKGVRRYNGSGKTTFIYANRLFKAAELQPAD